MPDCITQPGRAVLTVINSQSPVVAERLNARFKDVGRFVRILDVLEAFALVALPLVLDLVAFKAFDLAGQLVVWSTVLSGFVIFFASCSIFVVVVFCYFFFCAGLCASNVCGCGKEGGKYY